MAQPKVLTTKEADIQMMLSAEVHLGTKNCDFQMERYAFKRRNDGIHFILLHVFVFSLFFIINLVSFLLYDSIGAFFEF